MHFMIMHKNDPQTEAGLPPPPELVAKMGAFVGEYAQSGRFIDGAGLSGSKNRTRLPEENPPSPGSAASRTHKCRPGSELASGIWPVYHARSTRRASRAFSAGSGSSERKSRPVRRSISSMLAR